ncbi:MAG TPA: nitroreductase family protein [Methanoculleus sp.]|nr:nitroreductase family protein [Methanoculleus sp.]
MNLGITIIKGRRSVRKYKDTPIPEEAIHHAFDCAKFAPTARNSQPWVFGIVQNRETLAKIAGLATHGKFIKDAPACFAVFGLRDEKFYVEDCCAATENIILALWSYGIGSCWVAGAKMDYAEDIRALLNVPDEYALVSLIPAGYPEEMTIPAKKELDDITFREEYK